jgi:uncharacterized membrane protein YagU involved in acid resistance
MNALTTHPKNLANVDALRAIVAGAVAAGLLDATFSIVLDVIVLRSYSLPALLQWIASGAIGSAAFSGGLATAAIGLILHFVIAAIFAGFYYVVSRRVAALRTRPVPIGIAYGAAIWILMDLIVLPMSAAPRPAFDPIVFAAFLVDHAFFVGLPITLAVKLCPVV